MPDVSSEGSSSVPSGAIGSSDQLFHWGGTTVYQKNKVTQRKKPAFYAKVAREQEQKKMLEHIESEIEKHARDVEWTQALDEKLASLAIDTGFNFGEVAGELSKELKGENPITEAAARVRYSELEIFRSKKPAPERAQHFAWTAELDAKLKELVNETMFDFDAVASQLLTKDHTLTAEQVRCRFAELDQDE